MTLGRSSSGAIKIKNDGGIRAVSCGCCDGGAQPCNLFPASLYEKYFENPDNLPPEIYLGGQRQYSYQQAAAYYFDNPVTVRVWGGVTGGALVSRVGIGYGDTVNGVFLEPIDAGNPAAGYTWAVYKAGIRSTADSLIDSINRHDNFASSYSVSAYVAPFLQPWETSPYAGDSSYTIHRVGCGVWEELKYANSSYYSCDPTVYPQDGFITTRNPPFYLGANSYVSIPYNGLYYATGGVGGYWNASGYARRRDCPDRPYDGWAWSPTIFVRTPLVMLNGPWGAGIQGGFYAYESDYIGVDPETYLGKLIYTVS